MKELLYWELSNLLDEKTDICFDALGEHGNDVENVLLNAGVLKMDVQEGRTYNGSVSLSEDGLDLCMDDIEDILGQYNFELCFENLEALAL